jgi:DNA-binding transcriptional regulator YhcF (GntR family)
MLKKTSAPADSNAHEPRLYRVVADRIQELIRNENIAAGERLPSERDLATKLSVSRASLREALIALELGGVIEVRGGSGVYVSELPDTADLPEADKSEHSVHAQPRLLLSQRRSDRLQHQAPGRRSIAAGHHRQGRGPRKQGMTTLADLMMALPQSVSLQPSNAGSGTNINLRGLGVNRTLVLLNGRRLANEAIADGYANLDVIPMSALARVEILRDGASSIYGSDAIGGVVNFITKREVRRRCNGHRPVRAAGTQRRRRRAARHPHLRQGQSGTRRLERLRHRRLRTSARP